MRQILLGIVFIIALSASVQPCLAQSVSGTIVDRTTSKGIKQVTLYLSGIADGHVVTYTATSGPNGEFTFANLQPSAGYWLVAINEPDYVTAIFGQRALKSTGIQIPLIDHQNVDGIRISMVRSGGISGRVVDQNGKPQKDISVGVTIRTFRNGVFALHPSGASVRTDKQGKYSISGLIPGAYYVCINCPKGASLRIDGNDSSLPVMAKAQLLIQDRRPTTIYFPATTNSQNADPVYVHAGATIMGVDVIISSVRRTRIRGIALNPLTERAFSGSVDFLLFKQNAVPGDPPEYSFVSSNGAFDMQGIDPGSYVLYASSRKVNPQLNGRIHLVVEKGDISDIRIPMTSGFELSGVIAMKDSTGVKATFTDAIVTLRPKPPSLPGSVPSPSASMATISGNSPTSTLSATFQVAPIASVAIAGQINFKNISPWDYEIEVSGIGPNYYTESATLGTTDVLLNGLTLDASPNQKLEIVLSSNGGEIRGRVRDGLATNGVDATVVLIPESNRRVRRDLFKSVITDQNGNFQILGVAPGNYKLFAWRYIEKGSWLDSDVMFMYDDKGTPLQIIENSRQNIELIPIEPWL